MLIKWGKEGLAARYSVDLPRALIRAEEKQFVLNHRARPSNASKLVLLQFGARHAVLIKKKSLALSTSFRQNSKTSPCNRLSPFS